MDTSATNAARHRRAVSLGLSASVAVHVTLLVGLTFPGAGPVETPLDPGPERDSERPFEAVELIRVVEEPSAPPSVSSRPARTADGSQRSESGPAPAARTLESRMADLTPARVAVTRPDHAGPVVTFSDFDMISSDEELMMALYGSALLAAQQGQEEGGGLGGLLSAIGQALSGGGHCPTPATSGGPLILR